MDDNGIDHNRIDFSGISHNLYGFNFRTLFLEMLGWDRHRGTWPIQVIEPGHVFDEPIPQTFRVQAVAEKKGVPILHCPPTVDGDIPSYPTRCRIQHEIAKLARENVVIFTDQAETTQIWQWVRRATGEQPQYCEHEFQKPSIGLDSASDLESDNPIRQVDGDGEPLVRRLGYLAFSLADEEHLTLTKVVQCLWKAFYNYLNTNRRGSYSRVRLSDYDIAALDPSVQFWVEQVYAEARLSRDEEYRLGQRMAAGDRRAREKFIRAHLYVVSEIAWRLCVDNGLTDDQFLDLVQRGNLLLVRLADKYDYTSGGRFKVAAALKISSTLSSAVTAAEFFCYIPQYQVEHVAQITRLWQVAEDTVYHRFGRLPMDEEIAAEIGVRLSLHPRAILFLRRMTAPAFSWEVEREEWEALEDDEEASSTLRTGVEPTSLFVDQYHNHFPSDAAVNLIRREQLELVLNKLTPRERDVVWMRFGLDDGYAHTLEEVGQRFRMTRERVRQIELRALKRLRRMGPVGIDISPDKAVLSQGTESHDETEVVTGFEIELDFEIDSDDESAM